MSRFANASTASIEALVVVEQFVVRVGELPDRSALGHVLADLTGEEPGAPGLEVSLRAIAG